MHTPPTHPRVRHGTAVDSGRTDETRPSFQGTAVPPKKTKQHPKPLEATLWDAADELRGKMDSASYKHVVLGLVFP